MKGVKTLITIYTGLKNLAERNNTINALVIAANVACKSIDFIDVTPDYQTCKHEDNACTDKPEEKNHFIQDLARTISPPSQIESVPRLHE